MSNFTSINPSQFTQLLNALNNGGGGGGGGSYTLPIASESVLGGVKIGNGLSIENDGKLNVNATVSSEVQYSTTEKRIGTWVDGTSLFEKTLNGTIELNGREPSVLGRKSELLPNNAYVRFIDSSLTSDIMTIVDSYARVYIYNMDDIIYINQDATPDTKTWSYNIRFRYTKNEKGVKL